MRLTFLRRLLLIGGLLPLVAGASTINFGTVSFRFDYPIISGTAPNTITTAPTWAMRDAGCLNNQTSACTAATGASFQTGTYPNNQNSKASPTSAQNPTYTKSLTPTLDLNGDPVAPIDDPHGIRVNWKFNSSAYPDLPKGLKGDLAAHMYMEIDTTPKGDKAFQTKVGKSNVDSQPFSQTGATVGHIYITKDVPFDNPNTVAVEALFLLLRVDFVWEADGTDGGTTITGTSDTSQSDYILYRSQILSFGNSSQRDLTLGANAVTPCVSLNKGSRTTIASCYSLGGGIGNYMRNFVSTGSGEFGSTPRPALITENTPEPMTMLMVGSAIVGLAVFMRRQRKSKA